MQTVPCPGCGADVQFRSHASVMAVCEFCHASVLKDADAVRNLGKMSSVLEDFSPLQIGSAGVYAARPFAVVGRIQLRYDAGMWNEWYLLFEDGGTAWLGDSSGLYVLTAARPLEGPLPAFAELEAGKLYTIGAARLMAAEIRTARCIGGQGELPFRVGEGWEARVADLRAGEDFVTLDYSDGELPLVYGGNAVTLEALKFQLLREEEQIKESAGKYRGKTSTLDCPGCGAGIKYLPGVTTSLVCPNCHSQLDAAGPQAQVLAAGAAVDALKTTIALGALASINGQAWQVIGAMVRVDDENKAWTEYLLYNARSAFFWLVETPDGWSRASVMSAWPQWNGAGSQAAVLDKISYGKLYDYRARVIYAAGAFNWRVAVGDSLRVHEFESGQARLAAEMTHDEMTWSRSTPLAFDQLKAWFGKELGDAAKAPPSASKTASSTTTKFMWWMLGLNIVPLLADFSATWIYVVLGALAIYLPAKLLDSGN